MDYGSAAIWLISKADGVLGRDSPPHSRSTPHALVPQLRLTMLASSPFRGGGWDVRGIYYSHSALSTLCCRLSPCASGKAPRPLEAIGIKSEGDGNGTHTLGTSAFTAAGWPGSFYPAKLKPAD